jgi:hypothetical protein
MKSDMRDREWLDEYMSLKQINPNDPFTVPPGYFDELEQKITSAVALEQLKSDKGFTVPQNYFDELNANIQSRINIEAYVNTDAHGHAVPAGYFDSHQQEINARILIEEALNEQESFAVPAGYFEQLNKAIINKTVNQDIVRRKGIVRKMFASGAFKYAAAACLALVVGTGVFVNQVNGPGASNNTPSLHDQLSAISVSDIQSYLQDDVDANETQHTVIDMNAPVNDAGLNNALQDYVDTSN